MTQKHLVLIDDQDDLRWVLKIALQGKGYRVSDFSDGESALSATLQPSPDIFIIDSGLPGLNGIQVGRRILDQCRDNRPLLVLFTGTDNADLRAASTAAGFAVVIVKPVDIESLTRQLESLIDHPANPAEGTS